MNRIFTFTTLGVFLSCAPVHADHPTLSLDEGGSGPLTTISAIGVPEKRLGVSFQSQFLFHDEISSGRLIQSAKRGNPVHSTGLVSSYSINSAFGISDKLSVGFSLPYVIRNDFRETITVSSTAVSAHSEEKQRVILPKHAGAHAKHAGAHPAPTATQRTEVISYDIEGLSDATFFGQYGIVQNEDSGFFLSLLGGVKIPTGKTDVRGPGGFLVATDHQPGSGSWDPLFGFALTKNAGAWSFDVNTLYTFSTEGARGTTVGDILHYNAAISYRLLGGEAAHEAVCHHPHSKNAHDHHHSNNTTIAVDLFVEANGDYRERAETRGIADPNTGGNVVFLSGGSRITLPDNWSIATSVGTPVITDLNGIQSPPELRILIGVSKAF